MIWRRPSNHAVDIFAPAIWISRATEGEHIEKPAAPLRKLYCFKEVVVGKMPPQLLAWIGAGEPRFVRIRIERDFVLAESAANDHRSPIMRQKPPFLPGGGEGE